MKICFLADSGSVHTEKWCEAFANMGHQVSLISFNSKCLVSNVDFYPVNIGEINSDGGNWKVLLKYVKVKKILKKIKPDVLHAHYATSYGIVGALTNFHPYAITTHGSDVLISPKSSKMYKLLLRFAFKRTDWINLVSDHMVGALNYIGDFENKIDVIPFGIDTSAFNAKKHKANPNKFVITSTRSFENVYNLPHLIKAVSELKKVVSNVQLNLVGDGSKREELKQLVSDLNLGDVTKFYGKIGQKEIVEILNESHIYCSVSLSDGNSISLVEALACGCVPVVTDIVANHQWVKQGQTGYLVKINDVEELKNTLLEAWNKYDVLAPEMGLINQKNIANKADLTNNLKLIEEKYSQLIQMNN